MSAGSLRFGDVTRFSTTACLSPQRSRTFRQKTAILQDFFDPEGWLQSRTPLCPSSTGPIFLCDVGHFLTIRRVAKFTLGQLCIFSFLAADFFR